MSPEQLADVLVGIARAQAAMAEAVASFSGGRWQDANSWNEHLLLSGVRRQDQTSPMITIVHLPTKLLDLATSPGRHGDQNLQAIALGEVARLTREAQA